MHGHVSRRDSAVEQYNTPNRSDSLRLLNGSDRSLLARNGAKNGEMLLSAFHFERAAKYRDRINAVNSLINKEKVIEFTIGE